MTATQKPESTAVQMTEVAAIGNLPPEIQQQLELRKLSNQVAGKLAELNWGKQLDHATRRAVADWGNRFGVDTTIEINVLGGNVYINAAYYLRRLSELIDAGLVEYAYADHIEDDPRLLKLGPDGEGESSRRLRMRIMYGVKGDPASCVAFRVKLRNMDREVVGVKACGGGVRKNDPVGDAFPTETAETRAARRCMRLLVSHVPKKLATEIEAIEESADALGKRIASAKHQFKEETTALEIRPSPLALPSQGDPYGPVATVEKPEPEPVGVDEGRTHDGRNGTRGEVERACATPLPPTDAAAEPKRSAAYLFKMPFGALKGTPIGEIPPEDLDKWYQTVREQAEPDQKARAFIGAVEELINERDLERGE